MKAIAHHGEAAFKRFRQFEELAGEDVIVAHRLLKNSIASKEYILMTERFCQLSGGVPGGMHESRVEDCEGIGKVPVKVYYPATSELMVPRTPPFVVPAKGHRRHLCGVGQVAVEPPAPTHTNLL